MDKGVARDVHSFLHVVLGGNVCNHGFNVVDVLPRVCVGVEDPLAFVAWKKLISVGP